MRRVQNRVADTGMSARESDIFSRIRVVVMRFAARQMAVIVVLMHDHHRRRAVDHSPIFLTRLVDHPVVPASATDGEMRDVRVAGFWEEEKIAASGTMKLVLLSDRFLQPRLPAFREVQRSCDIVIPALTQQNKLISQLLSLFRRLDKIRHQDHIRVDDAKQSAIAAVTGGARNFKHGHNKRRTVSIACYMGRMFYAKLFGSFGKSILFANENNLDIGKQRPLLDRITLDHRNVRIGEWFWSGKKSE
jgi:hypothetical protein